MHIISISVIFFSFRVRFSLFPTGNRGHTRSRTIKRSQTADASSLVYTSYRVFFRGRRNESQEAIDENLRRAALRRNVARRRPGFYAFAYFYRDSTGVQSGTGFVDDRIFPRTGMENLV